MAYSYILYTGNGTTQNYTFPFEYLDAADIKVRVNQVLTSYTLLNESTVTISPAPAAGSLIEIRRETISDTVPVDFADGSVLLERDLDLIAKYNLFTAQESFDYSTDAMAQDSTGNYDARNKRIKNLGSPIESGDAVPLGKIQYEYPKVVTVADNVSAVSVVASDLQAAVTYETDLGLITDPVTSGGITGDSSILTVANSIADVQTVAANIDDILNASNSVDDAIAAASTATTKASQASTSATNAATSATNAATSATQAATSASSASTSASTATTKASEAATSATNAASSASTATTQATTATTKASEASASASSAAASAASALAVKNSVVGYVSQKFTATSGQTTFTVAYGVGYENVYLNGVKLVRVDDYTATNGTSIVLATGATAGDVVEVLVYGGFTGAAGPAGSNGSPGAAGRGIVSTVRTSGTGAPGTTDTYTITYTDSTTSTFQVYNGANGTGSGSGSGSVTSVAMTVPTGLTVAGSPITTSGSLDVSLQSGYSIPTTASQTNWNTAYSWGNHASAGYLTSFTESDPVFTASPAGSITTTDKSNWNTAYSWGNHASAGYQAALVSGTNIKTVNGTSLLGSGNITISGGGASGDVVGPASATDNAIARFDGTTGKLIQNSGVSIDDTGNLILGASIDEKVYAVVDAAGVALSPQNGTIQTWTLGASRTPTAGTWNAGESMTLMINDGTAYTITWTTLAVTWAGGTAPTLATTGYTVIELWKVGTTIYGAYVGSVA